MRERDMTWWTLRDVVDWVRGIDPTATVGQIRGALEDRCASGRIRAHGRRWLHTYNQPLRIGHQHPEFVQYSDMYGGPQSSLNAISADEWKDLTFFARPTPGMNEPYHVTLTLALDLLVSPVELRSVSKHRLAWRDVEFCRTDVVREWPQASDVATQNEAEGEPRSDAADEAMGGRLGLRSSTRGPAALSNENLRLWYQRRVAELGRRGESSSGEDDWGAAKQEFAGRVTRARVREVREQFAPAEWKKQGRRSPRIAK